MEKYRDYEKLFTFIPAKYTEKEKKEIVKTAVDLAYICLKYENN